MARRVDGPRLPPAPAPRRFAQGLAGTLMLIVGVAAAALVFRKFCLGSFLFHYLRGDGAFARRTAPWASTD